MAAIGQIIDDKYEILKLIGQGGMSRVYLAMDKRLNKQWAVKEIEKRARDRNNEVVIQSAIAEANMIKRVDQQLRVTRIMMNAVDVYALPPEQTKLRAYMLNYFSMMMAISSIFLTLDGSKEALAKRRQLWDDLKAHDGHLYRRCRFSVAEGCNLPGWLGSKISIGGYRIAQKIFKFN